MTTPSPQKSKTKTQNLVSSNSKHFLEFPLIRNLGRATLSASRSRSFWDCRRGVSQGLVSSECHKEGKRGRDLLPCLLISLLAGLCTFSSTLTHNMSPTGRMIREREWEKGREFALKLEATIFLLSSLRIDIPSLFCICQMQANNQGEGITQGVNARIQRSLAATLEDTCHTAPDKQQS